MRQNLKINYHGVAGILFIILMFEIAFLINWNVDWWYFVIAMILYSWAIIFLTSAEEKEEDTDIKSAIFRCLLGCHLALMFLAVGLLLRFQDYRFQDYRFQPLGAILVIPAGILKVGYFIASALGGLAIPFLLSRLHGLVTILLVILMFGIAFFYSWNINWVYFIAAIVLYGVVNIFLYFLPLDPPPSSSQRLRRLRAQFGWHLTFIFLVVGFGLHFKDGGVALGFFIASIAAGLVIPYLLFYNGPRNLDTERGRKKIYSRHAEKTLDSSFQGQSGSGTLERREDRGTNCHGVGSPSDPMEEWASGGSGRTAGSL